MSAELCVAMVCASALVAYRWALNYKRQNVAELAEKLVSRLAAVEANAATIRGAGARIEGLEAMTRELVELVPRVKELEVRTTYARR